METDTVSIEQFINDNRISMTADLTDRNPNMDESRDMDHWKCTLRRGRARMTLVFSQGYGHGGKVPELADVLDCLASDASSAANNDFERWCSEQDYDTDSRRAERTYKAIEHLAARLKNLLGEAAFEQLLYRTERR